MVNKTFCKRITVRDTRWSYEQYFIGEKERRQRKGIGINTWIGGESIERFHGQFLRDTMHGSGEYMWRHKDTDGAAVTYEGYFYANAHHGYGSMSYQDGRVFTGLFYNNARWGPGVEQLPTRANVGFWRGNQLIRLTWQPDAYPVVPDFATGPFGPSVLNPFRTLLAHKTSMVGETNPVNKIMKSLSSKDKLKLYPTTCTDKNSVLFPRERFDKEFYHGKIESLAEVSAEDVKMENNNNSEDSMFYYAWNNGEMMVHMMKHCFQHEFQRPKEIFILANILNGPRTLFKPADKHEYDCRSLLLASYVGDIATVAHLINEEGVNPNVADMRGNTALMYAVCGNKSEVIHFLIEAGACVNSINDSCCTPLGVALVRCLCVSQGMSPHTNMEHFFKKSKERYKGLENPMISEWLIDRENRTAFYDAIKSSKKLVQAIQPGGLNEEASKHGMGTREVSQKNLDLPKEKEVVRVNEENINDEEIKDKFGRAAYLNLMEIYKDEASKQFKSEEAKLHNGLFPCDDEMITEYIKYHFRKQEGPEVIESKSQAFNFTCNSSTMQIEEESCEAKQEGPEVIESKSQAFNFTCNSSTMQMEQSCEALYDENAIIHQLLSEGADPRLVVCPQPVMLLAWKMNSEVMLDLISHGADSNQTFAELSDYTLLEYALSRPMDEINLRKVKILLDHGANPNDRLRVKNVSPAGTPVVSVSVHDILNEPGPTLLHILLAKRLMNPHQLHIRNQLIELLLTYKADPTSQFLGRSPIDVAMDRRESIDILNIFVSHPAVDLNSVINNCQRTILVKFFSLGFFKPNINRNLYSLLSVLLAHGADPLIPCMDKNDIYRNMFEFARFNIKLLMPTPAPPPSSPAVGPKRKIKALLGTKRFHKKLEKSETQQAVSKEYVKYKNCLTLMEDFTRTIHVQWLQARIMKRFISVVGRFAHRHWNIVVKDIENGPHASLWLTPARCIEIWNIFRTTKKKIYSNNEILKKVLYIVQFYITRKAAQKDMYMPMVFAEKDAVEKKIDIFLREYRSTAKLYQALGPSDEFVSFKSVKPELITDAKLFNVCFECCLPIQESHVVCVICRLIFFCNDYCLQASIMRSNEHPCAEDLRLKLKKSDVA